MRHKLFPLLLVLLLMACYLWLAPPAWAQDGSKGNIVGTKHDLRTDQSATSTEQVCAACHIPHRLASEVGSARTLLWNHTLSSTATYGTYNSSTFDGVSTIADIGGSTTGAAFFSTACMSCHDGTVAPNSVYRTLYDDTTGPGTGPGTFGTKSSIGGGYSLGIDLTDDHPVNFTYDSALATADGGLFTPVTVPTDVWGTVRTKPATYTGVDGPVLFGGTLQCATCHNPHNNVNKPFLRKTKSGSQLCLECHNTT